MRRNKTLYLIAIFACLFVLVGGCLPANAQSFAYVANLNSCDIWAYKIDATTGALSPVPGSPFAAGLGPQSVAVHPSGKFVYVANSGSGFACDPFHTPGVSVYTIDSTTGALRFVQELFAPNPNLATGPPFLAGSSPNSVAVDPSGKFAYVANGGDGTVSAYIVDSTTGALSPVTGSPFATGFLPFSVTVDPSATFAYVANEQGVSAYTIDSTTGALSPASGSPFQAWVTASLAAVDPSGKFAYVANFGDGTVSAYAINSTTGALSPVTGSPFAAGLNPISVAVDPSGKFAYVANQGDDSVWAYRIDSATGVLSPISGSPFLAGYFPSSVAIAVVNTTEPFATFKPQAAIDLDKDAFVTFGRFTLGTGIGSDGIAPAAEPVQLNVGTFSITIPAGSFRKNPCRRVYVLRRHQWHQADHGNLSKG
jgi:DNA-binding beta-propeller fold protein YncE